MSAKLIFKTILLIFSLVIAAEVLASGYEISYRLIYGKASYSTNAVFKVPNSKVEIILERRAAHLFLGEYERTLILRIKGKDVLRMETAFDTGGYSRMNIYQISATEYFLSGAFSTDSYILNVERKEIVLPDFGENFPNAKFIGAFDRDQNRYWRFISASERKELKTGL